MGIRTIIAMNPDGIPYFSGNYICQAGRYCDVLSGDKVAEASQDPMMLSGFFSALQNMAKTGGGELQEIEFENFKFIANANEKVVMIFSLAIEDSTDEFKNRLQIAMDEFLKVYGNKLDDWTGNTLLFDSFQMLLENAQVFDEKPEFRKNCIECEVNQDCSFRMVKGFPKGTIKETMAKFPKMSMIKKGKAFMKEIKKYISQKKRYKSFQKTIEEAKIAAPKADFANLIMEKVKSL